MSTETTRDLLGMSHPIPSCPTQHSNRSFHVALRPERYGDKFSKDGMWLPMWWNNGYPHNWTLSVLPHAFDLSAYNCLIYWVTAAVLSGELYRNNYNNNMPHVLLCWLLTHFCCSCWCCWCWCCRLLLHSAILCSPADSPCSHVILHEWIAFYSAFFTISRSGSFSWCYMEKALLIGAFAM